MGRKKKGGNLFYEKKGKGRERRQEGKGNTMNI